MRRKGQRKFRGVRGVGKTYSRTIPMSDEVAEAFKQQQKLFEEKFGRPPGPNDPVFFNPDSDVPEPMTEQQRAVNTAILGDAMRTADVDPAKIYAYEKTGFIATERNWPLLDEIQKQEWSDAIAEYEAIPKE